MYIMAGISVLVTEYVRLQMQAIHGVRSLLYVDRSHRTFCLVLMIRNIESLIKKVKLIYLKDFNVFGFAITYNNLSQVRSIIISYIC
jgi:hypothetical protein